MLRARRTSVHRAASTWYPFAWRKTNKTTTSIVSLVSRAWLTYGCAQEPAHMPVPALCGRLGA
eukprot:348609-Pyramimonas_sp.AAC.1